MEAHEKGEGALLWSTFASNPYFPASNLISEFRMDDQPIYEVEECFDGRFDFRNTDGLFGRMRERSVARPK